MTIKSESNIGCFAISDSDGDLQGLEGGHLYKASELSEVHLFEDLPSISRWSNELANEGYFIVEVMIRASRA